MINRKETDVRLQATEQGTVHRAISFFEVTETFYVDSTGIPLSSDRREPDYVNQIDFQYRPNAFKNSPSRYLGGKPHPIPVSGLEQRRLGETYRDMMGIVETVRDGFVGHFTKHKDPSRPLDVIETSKLLDALTALPHYLTFRTVKSFSPQGEIPPSVIVLSNSASGSKGALEAWIELHQQEVAFHRKTPDVEEMIEITENIHTMAPVHGKTVCAASPAQQRHFLEAVIHGPSEKSIVADNADLLREEEVEAFVKFGVALKRGIYAASGLRGFDAYTRQLIQGVLDAGEITPDRKKEAQDVADAYLEQFLSRIAHSLSIISFSEQEMNEVLGRGVGERNSTTLEDLDRIKPLGCMQLIKEYQIRKAR